MAIKGLDRHLARVRAIASETGKRNINKALFATAQDAEQHARGLITAGATGTGKNHVPSRPGEPPNEEWGHLAKNVIATQPRDYVAELRSGAEYAAALEFGTSKMAPRPYMAPTREYIRGVAKENVEEAINATIRGAK